MATVTGFTAARMLVIENSTVVDGEVQGDNLILQTRDGTPIDAGSVRGPQGIQGEIGPGVLFPGMVSMFAGPNAPAGYLLCQGQLVSRTTYAALFAAIGTVYGAGDGLTNFNLPNLQQRFPVGKGTEAWADVIGEGGGSKDAVVVNHNHDMGHTHNTANHQHDMSHPHSASASLEDRPHTHYTPNHQHLTQGGNGEGYPYRSITPGTGGGWDIINPGGNDVTLHWVIYPTTSNTGGGETSGVTQNHSHGITVAGFNGSTGPAGAQALTHTGNVGPASAGVVGTDKNLPPYLVLNFIIKT